MKPRRPKPDPLAIILEAFPETWLQFDDGWLFVGPHAEANNTPKRLLCVGAKLKNEGWSRARWFWWMVTTKAELNAAVKRAWSAGASEVKVRHADIDWEEQQVPKP